MIPKSYQKLWLMLAKAMFICMYFRINTKISLQNVDPYSLVIGFKKKNKNSTTIKFHSFERYLRI